MWTPARLLAFEQEIADLFAAGNIKSPVHLSSGNEESLLEIFEKIQPDDWVLCGWRSHYHCLLKGVSPDELRHAIVSGYSVSLCFRREKVLCSGIVGGIAPIAIGIAMELKKKNDEAFGSESFVWCFLGDMSAETGIVHESMKYAVRHDLPVKWVVEDNGKSVCTDTQASWGHHRQVHEGIRYRYELGRPHVGIGEWVRF